MTNVEPIISKLPLPKGNNNYFVLCLAVQEAVRLYPRYPTEISLEELCSRILRAAGKSSAKSVRRSLECAVEKFSAKDFIASAARYICRLRPVCASLQLVPTGTPFRYVTEEGMPYFAIPCAHPAVQTILPAFLGGEPL